MKRLLILVPILALLMWLPSCDNGGGDGGGDTGGTTGYTLADLAGTWVLSITKEGWTQIDKVTIDANGNVTKYTSLMCGGNGSAVVVPGTFTIFSDGKLRLVNTRFNCTATGLDVYYVQSYKLKLTSPTTLTGAVVLHRFCDVLAPPCSDWNVSWPTSGVKQ